MTTTTTIDPLPAGLHLVIAMNRSHGTLASFWETREEAEKHVRDLTDKDRNPENGYIWATVTAVGTKSWKPNMPNCEIAWVPAVLVS